MRPHTRIFVANLSYDVADRDLAQFLEARAGRLVSCTISRDYLGKSRGFALIEFVTAREAWAARALSGTMFAGRKIDIRPHDPTKTRLSP